MDLLLPEPAGGGNSRSPAGASRLPAPCAAPRRQLRLRRAGLPFPFVFLQDLLWRPPRLLRFLYSWPWRTALRSTPRPLSPPTSRRARELTAACALPSTCPLGASPSRFCNWWVSRREREREEETRTPSGPPASLGLCCPSGGGVGWGGVGGSLQWRTGAKWAGQLGGADAVALAVPGGGQVLNQFERFPKLQCFRGAREMRAKLGCPPATPVPFCYCSCFCALSSHPRTCLLPKPGSLFSVSGSCDVVLKLQQNPRKSPLKPFHVRPRSCQWPAAWGPWLGCGFHRGKRRLYLCVDPYSHRCVSVCSSWRKRVAG